MAEIQRKVHALNANQEAISRAIGAWNDGNLDGYLTLYDSGIRVHGFIPAPMDKGMVTAFYRDAILGAFPDAKLTVHESLATDDKVTLRFTMSGTHRGDFMGVPPTGKPISLDGITILRFRAGKCIERWSTADMLGVLQQIGAVPAPG